MERSDNQLTGKYLTTFLFIFCRIFVHIDNCQSQLPLLYIQIYVLLKEINASVLSGCIRGSIFVKIT